MTVYHVIDESGTLVSVEEKSSIVLLVFIIILAIGVVITLLLSFTMLLVNPILGGFMLYLALLGLIYIFILNHLRRKADMDKNAAAFKTLDGSVVVVRKKSSVWITLALILVYISIVFAVLAFIAFLLISPVLAVLGLFILILLIPLIIVERVLRFIRTKLDFECEKFQVRSEEGIVIEFYKSRSFWLTLGLILTILNAVFSFIIGFLIVSNSISTTNLMPSMFRGPYHRPAYIPWINIYQSISWFIGGIVSLIYAAILNFLRVWTHVRPVPSTSGRTENIV